MGAEFKECHLEDKQYIDNMGNFSTERIESCRKISQKQYYDGINRQKEISKKNRNNLVPVKFKKRYVYEPDKYKEVKNTPDIYDNIITWYNNIKMSYKLSPSLNSYLLNLSVNSDPISNFGKNIGTALHPFINGNLKQGLQNIFNWTIPWNDQEVINTYNNFYNNLKKDYQSGRYTLKTADSFNTMVLIFGSKFIGKKFDKNQKFDNWSDKPHNGGNKTGREKNNENREKKKNEPKLEKRGEKLFFVQKEKGKVLIEVQVFEDKVYDYNGKKAIWVNYFENKSKNKMLPISFIKKLKLKLKLMGYDYILMEPKAYVSDLNKNYQINIGKITHKDAGVLIQSKLEKFYSLLGFYKIPYKKAIGDLKGKWISKN